MCLRKKVIRSPPRKNVSCSGINTRSSSKLILSDITSGTVVSLITNTPPTTPESKDTYLVIYAGKIFLGVVVINRDEKS
jgi:hypothetical protein